MKLTEEIKEQIVLERMKAGFRVLTWPELLDEVFDNQFDANCHEEWAYCEAKRIGGGAVVEYFENFCCWIEKPER